MTWNHLWAALVIVAIIGFGAGINYFESPRE